MQTIDERIEKQARARVLREMADEMDPPAQLQIERVDLEDIRSELKRAHRSTTSIKLEITDYENGETKIEWALYDEKSGARHGWTVGHGTLKAALTEWRLSNDKSQDTIDVVQQLIDQAEPLPV